MDENKDLQEKINKVKIIHRTTLICVAILLLYDFRDTNKELSHSKEMFDSVAYYRSIVDSLRRIKQDSAYIEKVVEKKLSLWDRTKIRFGGLAFIIVAATIIYLTWYIKRKDRQNI